MAKPAALPSATDHSPAAQKILDVAERLAQVRGFNGFSYADIAAELAVTKASLHYHFASKAALGSALIVRYQVSFAAALEAIDAKTRSARDRLSRYVALYDNVMRNDRMCLCGMFAAESATLPTQMQQELRRFFDANERWLTTVLEQGRGDAELSFWDPPQERARIFLGALEGAMLVARSYKDHRRFQVAAEHLLGDLTGDARGQKTTRPVPRRRKTSSH
jgi:TetR/AcrR family transcriptional regulator, transcriptional repressor for nem operon